MARCQSHIPISVVFKTSQTGLKVVYLTRCIYNALKICISYRRNRKKQTILSPYENLQGLEICWGDLNDKSTLKKYLKDVSLVLHIAAFVSPQADYDPKKAMLVNYGGTKNMIEALYELKQDQITKFVYIGTVADTGDRMPPIHWGRVGDPIKPSIFDYYAVSKVAAERYLIE